MAPSGRPVLEVVEFTDPGCVWSWSSEPKLRWLRHHYAEGVLWRRVLGVQIDDIAVSAPDRDPSGLAAEFHENWLAVAVQTGAPLTGSLEWMHRSTRPACAAVKAATQQGDWVAERVLRRLREAVFVAGRPADSEARIEAALSGTHGLDLPRLMAALACPAVTAAVAEDFAEASSPRPEVIGLSEPLPHPGAAKLAGDRLRYSFPTLVLKGAAGERVVPGWRSLDEYTEAFETLAPQLRDSRPRLFGADEALERYRSLTTLDLELLSEDTEPPAAGVRIDTATTPLWLHPDEVPAVAGPALADAS